MATSTDRPVRWYLRGFGIWIAFFILTIGVPVAIAVYARIADPAEWRLKDTAGVISSTSLGIIFFFLAWAVNRRTQARTRAAADSSLLRTIGALEASSARTFAGDDQFALSISADARAALQYLPYASKEKREALIETIGHAYSNLAFGTMCRADALPKSVHAEIEKGIAETLNEVSAVAVKLNAKEGAEVVELGRHIRFVAEIGSSVRSQCGTPLAEQEDWEFESWTDDAESSKRDRLSRLYSRELTVVHDWNVLVNKSVEYTIKRCHVSDTDKWTAPWFVKKSTDRSGATILEPANVAGRQLGAEVARLDEMRFDPDVPTYPHALGYNDIPDEMRTRSIDRIRQALEVRDQIVVSALVYVTAGRTIVLDGNHRVAAARRIAAAYPSRDVSILRFQIAEAEGSEPVLDVTDRRDPPDGDKAFSGWYWEGFTPDITVLHRGRSVAGHLDTPEGPPCLGSIGACEWTGSMCGRCDIRHRAGRKLD